VPEHARDPVPWEAILPLAFELLAIGDPKAPFVARAPITAYGCYFRSGEVLRLNKLGAFPPRPGPRLYNYWAVTRRRIPRDRGVAR